MASEITPMELRQTILAAMFIADAEPCADRDGSKCCNYCKATYVLEAVMGAIGATDAS